MYLVVLLSTVIGSPCLSTHQKQARLMIELAELKPGMKVVDLGSGLGRLLFLAADSGADATGYELNPVLYWFTKLRAKLKKTPGRVEARWQSLFDADVRSADVVFCFLFNGYMPKLDKKLFSEMKPGAKIIGYTFPFKNRKYFKKEQGVFVYCV